MAYFLFAMNLSEIHLEGSMPLFIKFYTSAPRDDPVIWFVDGTDFFFNLLRGILSGCEYNTVLITTKQAPHRKAKLGRKLKKMADKPHEITIEADAAKVFSTLSAYLITTATIRPPIAWTTTTVQTTGEYPTKNPFSAIIAPSSTYAVINAIMMDGSPIWIFRIHRLVEEPFNIFSKKTPENPEVHAAKRIATRPRVRFCVVESSVVSLCALPEIWTIATPTVREMSANHFFLENWRWYQQQKRNMSRWNMLAMMLRVINICVNHVEMYFVSSLLTWSIKTLNNAVVKILSW